MKSLLVAGVLALNSLAPAAPVCFSGPLSSYVSLGADGCMLGTNRVSLFTLFPVITGATSINPATVSVTPTNSTTDPALTFATTAGASSNQLFELLLMYSITGLLTGDMITLSGSTIGGDGAVTDIQNYCLGGTFTPDPPNFPGPCSSSKAGGLLVLNSGSDSAKFSTVPSIAILHDLTLDGGTRGSAVAATVVDQFATSAVSAVPEPASLLLLASGLGAGLLAMFISKKGKI